MNMAKAKATAKDKVDTEEVKDEVTEEVIQTKTAVTGKDDVVKVVTTTAGRGNREAIDYGAGPDTTVREDVFVQVAGVDEGDTTVPIAGTTTFAGREEWDSTLKKTVFIPHDSE